MTVPATAILGSSDDSKVEIPQAALYGFFALIMIIFQVLAFINAAKYTKTYGQTAAPRPWFTWFRFAMLLLLVQYLENMVQKILLLAEADVKVSYAMDADLAYLFSQCGEISLLGIFAFFLH